MPFFSGRRDPSPPPREPTPPPVETSRNRGLFSRRNHSPEMATTTTRNPPPPTQPVDAQPPRRSGTGIFNRRHRSPSPARTSTSSLSSGGSLNHHNSATYDSPSRTGTGSRGLLSKSSIRKGRRDDAADPSILAARERVMSAETAEEDADRALMAARQSVAAARSEVKRLELEAREESRRARIKAEQAAEVSKRGKALGRFS